MSQSTMERATMKRASIKRAARASPLRPTTRPGTAQWIALPELWLNPAHLRANQIVTLSPHPLGDPYDKLAQDLRTMANESGWRTIAVVAPPNGRGKTTTLVNLAFAMQRLPDQRVMALDYNLSKPDIGRVLGTRSSLGLADLLDGHGDVSQILQRKDQGLAFGLNHGSTTAAQPLHWAKLHALTKIITGLYAPDLILLDAPAGADEMSGLLHQADAALIVVEAGRHTPSEIRDFRHHVAGLTNLAGIVLNNCNKP